jgi:UDP-glucose 4-epimerase
VAPFRVVNIGNSDSVSLMDFIEAIEAATGQRAEKNFMDMQPGDVPATWADADNAIGAAIGHFNASIDSAAERVNADTVTVFSGGPAYAADIFEQLRLADDTN